MHQQRPYSPSSEPRRGSVLRTPAARTVACWRGPTPQALPGPAMMPKNGTVPGEDFDVGKLDPAAKASKGVPEAAREKLMPRQRTATESRRVGPGSMPRTPPRPRLFTGRG
jgi:hypothetical protein